MDCSSVLNRRASIHTDPVVPITTTKVNHGNSNASRHLQETTHSDTDRSNENQLIAFPIGDSAVTIRTFEPRALATTLPCVRGKERPNRLSRRRTSNSAPDTAPVNCDCVPKSSTIRRPACAGSADVVSKSS